MMPDSAAGAQMHASVSAPRLPHSEIFAGDPAASHSRAFARHDFRRGVGTPRGASLLYASGRAGGAAITVREVSDRAACLVRRSCAGAPFAYHCAGNAEGFHLAGDDRYCALAQLRALTLKYDVVIRRRVMLSSWPRGYILLQAVGFKQSCKVEDHGRQLMLPSAFVP